MTALLRDLITNVDQIGEIILVYGTFGGILYESGVNPNNKKK